MADPDEMNFDAASPSNKQAVEFGWMKEIRKGSFRGATTPVGHFQKSNENPFGLHDMSGNVYEWCWDWYSEGDYYKQCKEQGKVVDPKGPKSGDSRVVRGGSWSSDAGYCRASYRGRYRPIVKNNRLGFRVSRRL